MNAFREIHSEEFEEVISAPPAGLVRWGMGVFLSFFTLMAIGSWYIRYPDIVATSFTLASVDASRAVISRSEGKILKILIKDGQQVRAGDHLMYCESVADHDQILKLRSSLGKLRSSLARNDWDEVQELMINQYDRLGEIQTDFQTFTLQLTQIKTTLGEGVSVKKQELLLRDYEDLKEMEQSLMGQQELQQRDYELAKKEFEVHEKLYQNKALSNLDYQRERAKLLSREMPLKQIATSRIQNRTLQTGKQKELIEVRSSILQQRGTFLQALQTLSSSVDSWIQKYIVAAPIDGKISFSSPWQEQQSLKLGQELMTIEPMTSSFRGLIKIQQANLGKLHTGQVVQIKLDGYPFREFGMVKGILTQISSSPSNDKTYWGYVNLPNGLRTGYGRQLEYRSGLSGVAEIVTADRMLAERLLNVLKIEEFE